MFEKKVYADSWMDEIDDENELEGNKKAECVKGKKCIDIDGFEEIFV